jgi:hypothetical protein
VTSDEDGGDLSENPLDEPAAVPRPRPKPRPVRSENPLSTAEMEQIERERVVENDVDHHPSTTPTRPRPKAVYRTKSSTKSPAKSPMKSPAKATPLSDAEVNGTIPTSRKRTRQNDDQEPPAADQNLEDVGADLSLSREPTPTSDIQIRRKRVRH